MNDEVGEAGQNLLLFLGSVMDAWCLLQGIGLWVHEDEVVKLHMNEIQDVLVENEEVDPDLHLHARSFVRFKRWVYLIIASAVFVFCSRPWA